jgi:hypothetical protein
MNCFQNELWPFNDDTKAKFGKQKKKMFPEAMLEIETNPNIRCRFASGCCFVAKLSRINLHISSCNETWQMLHLKKQPPYTLAGFDLTTHSSTKAQKAYSLAGFEPAIICS